MMEITIDMKGVWTRAMLEITRGVTLGMSADSNSPTTLSLAAKLPSGGTVELENALRRHVLATASRMLDNSLVYRRGQTSMAVRQPAQFDTVHLPALRTAVGELLVALAAGRWLETVGESQSAAIFAARSRSCALEVIQIMNIRNRPESIYETDI